MTKEEKRKQKLTNVQKRFKILVDRMKFFDLYMKGDEIDTCLVDLETSINFAAETI